MRNKTGFTLAEVMIVLTVIGILAGILIPVANNARPDEKVMKFKKAHATLANVIHELVTSDKYYADGDLSKKFDNSDVTDKKYFCMTLTDIISTKSENCTDIETQASHFIDTAWTGYDLPTVLDEQCKNNAKTVGEEIKTTDNVVYYQANPSVTFFQTQYVTGGGAIDMGGNNVFKVVVDSNGFYRLYKIFCIDIDGIPAAGSGNCDDKKDVCPFGYGIRVDGKIMNGARADEWLEKDFQKGKNDN